MDKSGFHVIKKETFGDEVVGFKMFFPNGYGVSVIFGTFTESDPLFLNKKDEFYDYHCESAEVAVISPDGDLIPFISEGVIKSKVKPEQLPQIISWAMNK